MNERRITLAVTHWNRYDFLQECLAHARTDDRIAEIVIVDDCSTDGSYERLVEDWKKCPGKTTLYHNEVNQDCYRNKRIAVSVSLCEWVILFDSDNILRSDYLDALFRIPTWDPDIIYCPEFAEPNLNYMAFAGKTVSGVDMRNLINDPAVRRFSSTRRAPPARGRRIPPSPPAPTGFDTVLNTCNYFIHRNTWLSVWDGSVNPHTADSIYQAYQWLHSGRRMMIVPGLRYFHRIHDGSHYRQNNHKTGGFYQQILNKLRAL